MPRSGERGRARERTDHVHQPGRRPRRPAGPAAHRRTLRGPLPPRGPHRTGPVAGAGLAAAGLRRPPVDLMDGQFGTQHRGLVLAAAVGGAAALGRSAPAALDSFVATLIAIVSW